MNAPTRRITSFHPPPLGYPAEITKTFGRQPISLNLGQECLRIQFTPPITPEADWIAVSFSLAGQEGQCIVPRGVMRMILRIAEPRPRAPMETPVALLLLEMLLNDALTQLEVQLGSVFSLTNIGPPEVGLSDTHIVQMESDEPMRGSLSTAYQIGFFARFGAEESFAGLLVLPRSLLPPLLNLAPPLAARLPDPPVTASVQIGSIRTTMAELSALAPGYGLVLTAASAQRVTLIAGGRLRASGRLANSRIFLESGFHPHSPNQLDDWTSMNEAPPASPGKAASEPDDMALEQLQIPLSFELGRITLTLAELRAIGEGHVIEIGSLVEQRVSIMANGQRIGEGELVEIGQSLAVRITRIVQE